jgi:hypothetical protein
MTNADVTTNAQLEDANGKYDLINVVGLDLRGQTIKAKTVRLIRCSGDVIHIDADYVMIEGCMFMRIITRATDVRFIKAAFDSLTMKEPANALVMNRTSVFSVTTKSIGEVYIARSWISSILIDKAQFVAIYDSYIQNAYTNQDDLFIFSQNSAINRTEWPIVDGGPNARGARLNMFKGRTRNGIPVRTLENMEGSEETILVTVGHRQFSSVDAAVKHWRKHKKGMLELLEKASEQPKKRE